MSFFIYISLIIDIVWLSSLYDPLLAPLDAQRIYITWFIIFEERESDCRIFTVGGFDCKVLVTKRLNLRQKRHFKEFLRFFEYVLSQCPEMDSVVTSEEKLLFPGRWLSPTGSRKIGRVTQYLNKDWFCS